MARYGALGWDNQPVSDSPALWLWLDVETTGLLDSRPAVLEAAWMVTDSELMQLTPLRQRLCAIPCTPRWWERAVSWLRPDPLRHWPAHLMTGRVAGMHEESGLMWDWKSAEKVRDVAALDALILGDVVSAAAVVLARAEPGEEPLPVAVHLAGAGVAQFEARLLPAIGSRVLDDWHYRCADSSVAAQVMGVPKVTEPPAGGYLAVDVQHGVDPERAVNHPHRAVADVRAAWHQVRDLRARMGTLEDSAA